MMIASTTSTTTSSTSVQPLDRRGQKKRGAARGRAPFRFTRLSQVDEYIPWPTPPTVVVVQAVRLTAGEAWSTKVTFTLPCEMMPAAHVAPGNSAATWAAVGEPVTLRLRAAAIAIALPADDTPAFFVASWASCVRFK